MGSRCSAVGCETCKAGKMLMCRTHWYMIPMVLRQRVNTTWRAWRTREAGHGQNLYLDYVEARDDAIRSVADQEGRLADFTPDLPRLKLMSEARAERGATC